MHMRIDRTITFLTIVATITACSTPANSAATSTPDPAPVAAAPAPAPAPTTTVVVERQPVVSVNLRWDSGPLDSDYRRERSDLDAQQARERANLRAGETIVVVNQRQASENKALELRYSRGKASHSRTLPPSE
jgi:hypothetical protein